MSYRLMVAQSDAPGCTELLICRRCRSVRHVSGIEQNSAITSARLTVSGSHRRREQFQSACGRGRAEMDLTSTNLIVTLVIGGVIGWVASMLMKTNAQMGIVANVIIGIAGSFLGVFVANALGVHAHNSPAAWIIAILGAALLIVLLRALGVFNRVARVS
jgi:uncharacterized membrane protein YeaQ/YmgE (transglycosylase-associated protein family)